MRKILWITNCEPSYAAKHFGRDSLSGQWIDYSSRLLAPSGEYSLNILGLGHAYDGTIVDGINCMGFEMSSAKESISKAIRQIEPDIIHIWGTEFEHFLVAMEIARDMNLLDRTVVSIQGLVSEIATFSLFMLSDEVLRRKTLYERYIHNTIADTRFYYSSHGELEMKGLQIARHCIGRTDWDRAMLRQYNSAITYHRCNEILRQSFYANRWNMGSCEKHSIVFSQSAYMIKGFHIMVDALEIVKKFYPDVKLYTIGESPYKPKNFKEYIKRSSYVEYIGEQLEKKGLKDNVTFVGSLKEPEMIQHYLRGNVFVCASSIENSSNSIGEAMLLGMPVVASDVGGVKTFIDHGKEGLLYQANSVRMLADCIMRIFDDEAFALSLADHAHEKAQHIYDYNKNTQDLCAIYEEILK